jgi:hypothetical protein
LPGTPLNITSRASRMSVIAKANLAPNIDHHTPIEEKYVKRG